MTFLLNPFLGAAGGGGSAFLTGTTVHTMFPSTQTDIEIWFSLTDSHLKTVGNGGSVVNSNHRRIASDSAGTTLLKYDIVTPTSVTDSTGLIEGFYLLPSGSSSVDTVVYLAYNDNGVTTYQGDRASMWARKQFVNHGSDGSTLDLTDVTGNGQTLTNHSATATSGKIGGAVNFVAASSQYEDATLGTGPTNTFTVSGWANVASLPGAGSDILGCGHKIGQYFFSFYLGFTSAHVKVGFTQGADVFRQAEGATSVSTSAWHYVVGTYNGTTLLVYLDGAQDGTLSVSGNVQSGETSFAVGRAAGALPEQHIDGKVNAPRVDIGHCDSADRILAQYRNQSAPATYTTWT